MALVVLTLGIGATTAIFSVVDAVVLRGLPFDEHDRLVAVGERERPGAGAAESEPGAIGHAAPQNYLDWVAGQRVFESMAAIGSGWLTLRLPGVEPESLIPQRVTASFFDVLRVRPAIGRAFTADNEVAGRDKVAVLSDGLWRRQFGADPTVIGRVVRLDDVEGGAESSGGVGYEIVGVMPPEFAYPVGQPRATDIWVPYVVPADQRIRNPEAFTRFLQVIARLSPGVSLDQARAQMDVLALAIERANPKWNKDRAIGVLPLVDHIVGAHMRSWMLMLLGAVGIVLLIACANIANLLLARASARQRDVGIRATLGASRWRLVRQLLIESLVLSMAGTALAVVAASWGIQILRSAISDDVPRVAAIALNLRVLAAAALLSLVTGILFGIIPALQSSRVDLTTALKSGGLGSTGAGSRRLRNLFVVVELALAVVLVVGASLFIGSFVSVLRIDPGFDPENVLTTQISPPVVDRTRPRDVAPVITQIVEQIARVPGVLSAAATGGNVPLSGGLSMRSMLKPGMDLSEASMVIARSITPDYHKAMRIPIRRGRLFGAADRKDAQPVLILSESTARKYFPGEDPIGRTVSLDVDRLIVGVVGDVHQLSIEIDTWLEAYLPMAQTTASGAELVVHTSGDPYDVVAGVRAAVYAWMPDVPLRNIRTMEELVAKGISRRKVSMMLLGLFGVLGLAIASVGVYGVLAHMVTQRTREIGVRMALGATRSDVVGLVLRNAAAMVTAGLAIGVGAAWYLSAASKAFLYQLEPTDPRAFATAIAVLLAAALVASIVPARRAARVDPIVALRAE